MGAGPQQGQTGGKREQGWKGGPVSWNRRIGPHVALPADREPFPWCACSRLPQHRDRVPFRCGLDSCLLPTSFYSSES